MLQELTSIIFSALAGTRVNLLAASISPLNRELIITTHVAHDAAITTALFKLKNAAAEQDVPLQLTKSVRTLDIYDITLRLE